MAVFFFTNRRFERKGLRSNADNLRDALGGNIHMLANFVKRRLTAQVLKELTACLHEAIYRLNHVNGDTDGAALICDGARDSLTNPPGGIGTELVALAVVKLFDRTDEANID